MTDFLDCIRPASPGKPIDEDIDRAINEALDVAERDTQYLKRMMSAEVTAAGPVPNWADIYGERDTDIEKGICKSCDLPVTYSEDDERDDDEVCRRIKPFCLNTDNKVDWRDRALRAERWIAAVHRLSAKWSKTNG